MSEIVISENKSKDRIISVNASNELLYTVKGEKTECIYKNVSSDFDALIDKNGVITVLIVTLSGSLLCFTMADGEWKKYTVLDSRGGGKKINAVKIIKLNGRIHAFYCIQYDGRMMLVHHIFEGTDFSREPHVIDYIGLRCAYSVCPDDSYNIHIVYAGENSCMKYTVFSYSQKKYAASGVICEDEIRSVNAVSLEGRVYAAYLSKEHDYNVINCTRTDNGEKHTVGFGVDAVSEPCIFTDGVKIYVQWCERGFAFECFAKDDFKFSKPASIGQSIGVIRLRSRYNESVSCIDKCTGSTVKGAMASAKSVLAKYEKPEDYGFGRKGEEIEKYAEKYIDVLRRESEEFKNNDFEKRLSDIEYRMNELIAFVQSSMSDAREAAQSSAIVLSDVGEVNKENLEVFNNMSAQTECVNTEENEYNKNEEEL